MRIEFAPHLFRNLELGTIKKNNYLTNSIWLFSDVTILKKLFEIEIIFRSKRKEPVLDLDFAINAPLMKPVRWQICNLKSAC